MSFNACNRRLERLQGGRFGGVPICSAGSGGHASGRSNDLNAITGGRPRLVALRDIAAFGDSQTTAGIRQL